MPDREPHTEPLPPADAYPAFQDQITALQRIGDHDTIRQMVAEHDDYLGDVATNIMANKGDSLAITAWPMGEESVFTDTGQQPEHPLDLQRLDLPDSPEDIVPLALVVHHEGHTTIGLELLGMPAEREPWPPPRLMGFYLQNPGAASPDQPNSPSWQRPGDAALGGSSMYTQVKHSQNRVTDKGTLTIQATTAPVPVPGANQPHTAILIRPTPSKAEQRLMDDPEHKKIAHKVKRIGAFMGMAAVGALAMLPIKPNTDAPVYSAEKIVQPAHTREVDGIEQAERSFTKSTLDRARQAFDAYLRGDKQELERQAAEYHTNWMDQAAVEQIQQARTPAELRQNFEAVVGDLDIRLDYPDNGQLPVHISNSYRQQPAANFETSRTQTSNIIRFLNNTDPRQLQDLGPLTFSIVGNITLDGKAVGGYFADATERNPRSIVVLKADASEDAVGHEVGGHAFDMHVEYGRLQATIESLNPDGYTYSGLEHYEDSDLDFGGIRVVDRQYGNVNRAEDASVSAEGFTSDKPEVVMTSSTASEKVQAMLLALDDKYPGYLASMLLRNEPPLQRNVAAEVVDLARQEIANNKLKLLAGGVLLSLGLGALLAKQKEQLEELRAYQPLIPPATTRRRRFRLPGRGGA